MLLQAPEKFMTQLAGDFYHLQSPGALSHFLLLESEASLVEAVKVPSYRYYRIPKKSGGYRLISEALGETRRIQKRLNEALQAIYFTIKPPCVHGFVKSFQPAGIKKSILTNAKPHVGKEHILTIDLKDFFPSITARMVKDMFCSPLFGFSENLGACLALLVTDRGRLPQGACTSPVISNIVFLQADLHLMQYTKEHHLDYSRFADDLTFSSQYYIDSQIVYGLTEILRSEGFRVNPGKVRFRSSHSAQYVTGIKVNQKMNVDRRYLRRIRAILHDWGRRGNKRAAIRYFSNTHRPLIPFYQEESIIEHFHQAVRGRIEFIGQVRGREDPIYLKLLEIYYYQI